MKFMRGCRFFVLHSLMFWISHAFFANICSGLGITSTRPHMQTSTKKSSTSFCSRWERFLPSRYGQRNIPWPWPSMAHQVKPRWKKLKSFFFASADILGVLVKHHGDQGLPGFIHFISWVPALTCPCLLFMHTTVFFFSGNLLAIFFWCFMHHAQGD
jgi:hypothetical protein